MTVSDSFVLFGGQITSADASKSETDIVAQYKGWLNLKLEKSTFQIRSGHKLAPCKNREWDMLLLDGIAMSTGLWGKQEII